MSDRIVRILQALCVAAGLLILVQVLRAARGTSDTLSGLTVPKLSVSAISLPPASNAPQAEPPPRGPQRPAAPALPEPVKARAEKIKASEIFGPVPRPMPMGLLGIAGSKALLRGPNGAMGWLAEGEALGDMTLLRIGTNRALVEHEGKTNELTIFSGLGSESLLKSGGEKP